MKPHHSNQRNQALTLMDVMVILCFIVFLALMLTPRLVMEKRRPLKYTCENNLKQIGLAEKIWAADNGNKFPFEVSTNDGGTMEFTNTSNAWMNFLVMSNELSLPKILTCPEDPSHQPPAADFSFHLSTHISYFIALNNDADSQGWLSGDDNFEISGAAVKPGPYELLPNTPARWSSTRHNRSGNILAADTFVQSYDNTGLLYQLSLTTNHIIIP